MRIGRYRHARRPLVPRATHVHMLARDGGRHISRLGSSRARTADAMEQGVTGAADRDGEVHEQLSDLRSMLALAMLLTRQDSEASILHIVADAVESLGSWSWAYPLTSPHGPVGYLVRWRSGTARGQGALPATGAGAASRRGTGERAPAQPGARTSRVTASP